MLNRIVTVLACVIALASLAHAQLIGGGAITVTNFTPSFTSADQVVAFPTQITVAHGLGAKPSLIMVTAKNVTTECGWAVGDEAPLTGPSTGPATVSGPTAAFDATNVFIIIEGGMRIANKTTSADCAMTAANWKLVARAWK